MAGDSWTRAEVNRLLSPKVSYMEIDYVGATNFGGFSCGTCVFATPQGSCGNRFVLAPVSLTHGCCNLFEPAVGSIVFPPGRS